MQLAGPSGPAPKKGGGQHMIQIKDKEMEQLCRYVKDHFGINLIDKKTLVEGRLAKLLGDQGIEDFDAYFQLLSEDKSGTEVFQLIDKLTTNHTFFMREASHFDYFRDQVLPWLAESVKDRDLRIWCAGCSSGEEPYTLAMILSDFFGKEQNSWDMKILATDISVSVLKTAREGIYTGEAVRTLPKAWQLGYFNAVDNDRYRVCEGIRNQVIFRSFNLMDPVLPFRKTFHVIFCRNVMIYFDQDTKNQVVSRYFHQTAPGGYLFIGHTESLSRDTMGYKYILPSVYRKG